MKRTNGVPSGGAVKKILNNIDEKNKTQVSQNENAPIKISNAKPRTTDGLAVEKQADYMETAPLTVNENDPIKISNAEPRTTDGLTVENQADSFEHLPLTVSDLMDAIRNGKKLSDILSDIDPSELPEDWKDKLEDALPEGWKIDPPSDPLFGEKIKPEFELGDPDKVVVDPGFGIKVDESHFVDPPFGPTQDEARAIDPGFDLEQHKPAKEKNGIAHWSDVFDNSFLENIKKNEEWPNLNIFTIANS